MNRKIILVFVATITCALAFFSFSTPTPESTLSETEKRQRQQEQQIFSDWYEDYVSNLEQLDFNWKQYHRILGDIRDEIIDSDTAFSRLAALNEKQSQRIEQIRQLVPPQKLRQELYDLTSSIYHKQLKYAAAQKAAIDLCTAAADPENITNETDEDISRKLDEICVAQSPPALFTAEEISAIRDYLALPDEK